MIIFVFVLVCLVISCVSLSCVTIIYIYYVVSLLITLLLVVYYFFVILFVFLQLSSYIGCFFFFKQKTAYEMRISDWSSDVCSSDLPACRPVPPPAPTAARRRRRSAPRLPPSPPAPPVARPSVPRAVHRTRCRHATAAATGRDRRGGPRGCGCRRARRRALGCCRDRKSVVSGKSVSVRVDLGGRRIIKKKTITSQS